MTVAELRAKLSVHPDNMEVEIGWQVLDCHCEDYCRCEYEDKRGSISTVELTNESIYKHRPLLPNYILVLKG